MKVGGSAESLGLHVTASVVKSIFVVIIVDGCSQSFTRRSISDGMNCCERKNGASRRCSEDDIVLSARDVTVAFGGKTFSTICRSISSRRDLGFVGASGAGKSVLLRTILGLKSKSRGRSSCSASMSKKRASGAAALDMRLRRAVPAWRAVFGADGAGKRPGADARISRSAAKR